MKLLIVIMLTTFSLILSFSINFIPILMKKPFSSYVIPYATISNRNNNNEELLQSVNRDLQQYIIQRNSSSLESIPSIIEINNIKSDTKSIKSTKSTSNQPSFFDMVKPSGWYKDKVELDLKSRMDTRIPIIPHPFSYSELKRFGYEAVYDRIMILGGPHAVAKAIGYDWIEPIEPEEEWTEDMRSVSNESFALDMRGELSLGGSLEERLEAAARMDVKAIKQALSKIEKGKQMDSIAIDETNVNININNDPFETVNYDKPTTKKWKVSESMNSISSVRGERFSLKPFERFYSVLLMTTVSLSFGKATNDLSFSNLLNIYIDIDTIRDVSQYSMLAMIGLSSSSAALSIRMAKTLHRNPVLWGIIGWMGGPLAYLRLSHLPDKVIESKNITTTKATMINI